MRNVLGRGALSLSDALVTQSTALSSDGAAGARGDGVVHLCETDVARRRVGGEASGARPASSPSRAARVLGGDAASRWKRARVVTGVDFRPCLIFFVTQDAVEIGVTEPTPGTLPPPWTPRTRPQRHRRHSSESGQITGQQPDYKCVGFPYGKVRS